jgi:hypothetical protein
MKKILINTSLLFLLNSTVSHASWCPTWLLITAEKNGILSPRIPTEFKADPFLASFPETFHEFTQWSWSGNEWWSRSLSNDGLTLFVNTAGKNMGLWLRSLSNREDLEKQVRRIVVALTLVRRLDPNFDAPYCETSGLNGVSVGGLPFSDTTVRFSYFLASPRGESFDDLQMTEKEIIWIKKWFSAKYNQRDNVRQFFMNINDILSK